MKAKLTDQIPPGDWLYEIKLDGFRAIALIGGKKARLLSRNGKDLSGKFPQVLYSIAALEVDEAIIDGEIIALDKKGRSSFQLLQAFELGEKRPPLFYYGFDLIRLNGTDFQKRSVEQRKARLERLLKRPPGVIRYCNSMGTDGQNLLREVQKLGLEGLIGKRLGSRYQSGQRSGAWIKLKVQKEQEFVIGGYTDPAGSREFFGAILVGFYEDNRLRFAGKVGTGFNANRLRTLRSKFDKLTTDRCPFVDLPISRSGQTPRILTPSELKRCHWVKPASVCEIKFAEWTRDGRLRQPVFLGLREDKHPKEVRREQAWQGA